MLDDSTVVAGRPIRGKVEITIISGDDVLLADQVNPHKPADARLLKFAIAVVLSAQRTVGTTAHDLLQLAKPGRSELPAMNIDVFVRIVRPECFITSEVLGLTIAEPVLANGKLAGRWRMYILWRWTPRSQRHFALDRACRISRDSGLTRNCPSCRRIWRPAGVGRGMRGNSGRKGRIGHKGRKLLGYSCRICEAFDYFIDFPENESRAAVATLALWVMLTYIFPVRPAVPYLYIGGPLGSGKSRIFDILAKLVFRVLASSNTTAAALFRTLHERGGTLLMDEAERLRETTPDTAELRSILLAGYKRGGKAIRLEASGETFKTREFDCYGPKAIACIGGLPPAAPKPLHYPHHVSIVSRFTQAESAHRRRSWPLAITPR